MPLLTSFNLFLALKEAFDLPPHCTKVCIKLEVDAAVTVEATYYANHEQDAVEALVTELKRFRLVEIGGGENADC